MTERELLEYTDASKRRIAAAGVTKLADFIGSVPQQNLDPLLRYLAPIPGFRNASRKGLDEQRKRLVTRLSSGIGGKQSDRDWFVYRLIWLQWATIHLSKTTIPSELRKLEESETESIERRPFAAIESALKEAVSTESASREVLREFLAFGPFPDIDQFFPIIDGAPTGQELARRKLVDDLPKRIGALESQLREVADRSAQRIEDKSAPSIAGLAAQMNEIVQLASSLSSEVSSLASKLDNATTQIETVRQGLAALDSRIRVIEDPAGDSAAEESHYNEIDELPERVSLILGRVEALEVTLAAKVVEPRNDDGDVRDGQRISTSIRTVVASGEPLESLTMLCSRLTERFDGIGILKGDRESLAREIAVGIALGQQVSFVGSLGQILLHYVAQAIGGTWLECSIPVGLFDDAELAFHYDALPPNGRQIALLGANRSAYEVYGLRLRQDIVASQTMPQSAPAAILASLVEGPGALPTIASYAELGPIIDTDSIRWRTPKATPHIEAAPANLSAIRATVSRKPPPPEHQESLTATAEQMGLFVTALADRTMLNALPNLLELPNAQDEAQAAISILASWLLPYAKSSGVSQKRVRSSLGSGPFAGLSTSPRIERILSKWDA